MLPRNRLGWTAVVLLILLQGVLFRQYALREVVWLFPRYFDQAVYLDLSFRSYETMLAQGFLPGLGRSLALPVANGLLLHAQAAILYLLFGPSRLAALALLFVYFAAFQLALVATLRRLSGRWSVAFYGLGLLMTATAPYAAGAGLTDFRIDFVAFSLFGILLCAVVRSDFFASRRWSAAAGAAAALLVLFRYIAVVYLAGILGAWWLLTALRCGLCRRDPALARRLGRRLLGGLLAGAVLAGLTLPVLIWKRQQLWDYYVATHVLSADKEVRAAEAGVVTRLDSWLFYARALYKDHAGPLFLILAAAGVLVAQCSRLTPRVDQASSLCSRLAPRVDRASSLCSRLAPRVDQANSTRGASRLHKESFSAWSFLACALWVPYAILTLSVTKTVAVGGILLPPLLWLAVLPVLRLARERAALPLLRALACAAVLCGLHVQFRCVCRHDFWTLNRRDAEQALSLCDEVIHRSRANDLRAPVLSLNSITEYMNTGVVRVRGYERDGIPLDVESALGGSINDVDEPTARALLERSDFVVLSGDTVLAAPAYPFHQRMRHMRGWLRDYCAREFLLAGRYRVLDTTLELYARPTLRANTDAEGWITRRGLTLTGDRAALVKKPIVCLSGRINLRWLGRMPHVQVTLRGENGDRELPASFEVREDTYRLRFRVDPRHLPGNAPVLVTVCFDTYFVPRALGVSEDVRELVMEAPDKVILAR